MDGPHLGKLPPFFTIGRDEYFAVAKALRKPLSGYLGGQTSTGYWINKLSADWCETFGCKFAIPCNSATSGLLAACMAVGIKPGDLVWTSGYTMSASAASAKALGAETVFIDIETLRFSMNMNHFGGRTPKCIIVTNLFGHPAYLATMRTWCDSNNVWMIEDNAQAPFAMENGRYAGTIGHIGVFSLNVHKHIQSGEGGVVVTDSPSLAAAVDDAVNHGELRTAQFRPDRYQVGLNLRMPEPIAAIACVQLKRGKEIVSDRIELAREITDMFSGIPWLRPPVEDIGCRHVFYLWAGIVNAPKSTFMRDSLVEQLNSRGFPMQRGYSAPLTRIFATPEQSCPVAQRMEEVNLMSFEVCAYDPTAKQRRVMREIAKRAVGNVYEDRRTRD